MIKKIGILTGGDSGERAISLKSSEAIKNACNDLGYETIQIILNGNVSKIISELENVDFVFIALHGVYPLSYINSWDVNELDMMCVQFLYMGCT